ncbi:MAG: flagellar basal-body MS-ring/collar protein FliF [Nitrospinota bacterium]
MFKELKKFFQQIGESFKTISPARRAVIFVTASIVAGGFFFLIIWAQKPEYGLLFSKLTPEDSAVIINRLKSKRIDYQLSDNGRAIMIPHEFVPELRLELAAEGLPESGGVGFELFDKSSFGMTEFTQKLNYLRALQGELARTIIQFKEVDQARIHIVLPEKTLFKEDQKKTTASAVLKMKTGKKLDQNQVQGVVHLIASGVEGLDPSDITVVDIHGNILSGGGDSGEVSRLTASQLQYKQSYEKNMKKRVESMIENVVGQGRAIVRVTADLNFLQEERIEESFDPDSQVARSEQTTKEETTGAPSFSGVPGVQSNLPGTAPSVSQVPGAASSTVNETRNYELNKITRKLVEPVGTLKKLSVAAIIDGTYEQGEDGKQVFKARPEDEIAKYEKLIRSAVGFDQERGDLIEVTSMPFEALDVFEERKAMEDEANRMFWLEVIKYMVSGVVLLIIFVVIVRPLVQWVVDLEKGFSTLEKPKTVAEMEVELAEKLKGSIPDQEEGASELETFKKKAVALAAKDPKAAAAMVKKWMSEHAVS